MNRQQRRAERTRTTIRTATATIRNPEAASAPYQPIRVMVPPGARQFATYEHGIDLYWELEYAGGSVVQEPPEHASIVDTPKGATAVYLVKTDGGRVVAVPLAEGGHTYLPVFYRKRSQSWGQWKSDVDAVIIGRARDVGERVYGLMLSAYAGRVIDAPPAHIDETMIAIQINR